MSRMTLIPLAGFALSLGACSDLSGPNPGPDQGRVNVSMVSAGEGAAGGPALAGEPMSLGGTVLVIQEAQLVLRDIELKRLGGFSCENGGSGGSDSSGPGDGSDCEKLATGPMLVNLSLDARARQVISVAADTGTYTRVEFDIHKADDDTQADIAFLQQHPDFTRVSIRVRGTWNGSSFVFTSDLNAEQRCELFPPIVVRAGQATDVVLTVDVGRWFLNATGTAFVNPATANKGGQNEGLVKTNIKVSIEAFAQL